MSPSRPQHADALVPPTVPGPSRAGLSPCQSAGLSGSLSYSARLSVHCRFAPMPMQKLIAAQTIEQEPSPHSEVRARQEADRRSLRSNRERQSGRSDSVRFPARRQRSATKRARHKESVADQIAFTHREPKYELKEGAEA